MIYLPVFVLLDSPIHARLSSLARLHIQIKVQLHMQIRINPQCLGQFVLLVLHLLCLPFRSRTSVIVLPILTRAGACHSRSSIPSAWFPTWLQALLGSTFKVPYGPAALLATCTAEVLCYHGILCSAGYVIRGQVQRAFLVNHLPTSLLDAPNVVLCYAQMDCLPLFNRQHQVRPSRYTMLKERIHIVRNASLHLLPPFVVKP
jgi:hypothetical protein